MLASCPRSGTWFANSLSISIAKIILRLLVPLILALLLNEVVHHKFMRMAQTVFFLPYFLS